MIWVYGEHKAGALADGTYEALGAARALADGVKGKVTAVMLGSGIETDAKRLVAYGADDVLLVEDPALKDFQDEPHAAVLAALIRERKPAIVLFSATTIGRSLAPRLAGLLGVGLAGDCTEVKIGDTAKVEMIATRPAYSGNVLATITFADARPQMATIRRKAYPKPVEQAGRTGEVVKVSVPTAGDLARSPLRARARFVESVIDTKKTVNLAEADIIVSGGRGLGKPEGFKLIEEFAAAMGGAVGASRAAVDAGWYPYPHQVGLTGRTVSPKLYIACSISGAPQHLTGMRTSKVIVAINKDEHAPIFNLATFGIVGDLYEVIPLIIQQLKGRRG